MTFPIEFQYEGKTCHATVERADWRPIEYLVTVFGEGIIFKVDETGQSLEWGDNLVDWAELPLIISQAVIDKVNALGLKLDE